MKLDAASPAPRPEPPSESLSPGIYPYLGASITADRLRSIVNAYGGAVVSGHRGAQLAKQVPGVLLDPARYASTGKTDPEPLLDLGYEEWLARQQAAKVPAILTDTPRIPNGDRLTLHEALGRWKLLDAPTLAVLPIEAWWLKAGLEYLIDEVGEAGRPVAIVLLASYNGLDAAGAVQGLLTFIAEIGSVPVVLLRSDISAVGAVAYGAFSGFVGWSSTTRHGPIPMRQPNGEQDKAPGVFVPALHDYFRASKLPALTRFRHVDVLRCEECCCGENGLLRITELSETDLRAARTMADRHNMTVTEQMAQRIFSAKEPRDSWWEACKTGAIMSASLVEDGISFPASSWLRQWIGAGSPSHAPEKVR